MGYPTASTTKYLSEAEIYRSFPVVVKFLQVILGIVCVGIATYDLMTNFEDLITRSTGVVAAHNLDFIRYFVENFFSFGTSLTDHFNYLSVDQLFCRIMFLSVSMILLIISSIQLTWFPALLFSGPLKSRIISGVIYHLVGFSLMLSASLVLSARIALLGDYFYNVEMMRNLVTVGLADAALYLFSTLLALLSFVKDKTNKNES